MMSDQEAVPEGQGISGTAVPEMGCSALSSFRNSPELLGFSCSGLAVPKFLGANKRNSAENLAVPLFPLRGDVLSGTARLPRGKAALGGRGQ